MNILTLRFQQEFYLEPNLAKSQYCVQTPILLTLSKIDPPLKIHLERFITIISFFVFYKRTVNQ